MSNLTIDEVRKRKVTLENDIKALVEKFQDETIVRVSKIEKLDGLSFDPTSFEIAVSVDARI